MKGSRRGDFTRLREPADATSAVRMQQGRVQLDADWNEAMDVVAGRLRQGQLDLVGDGGAPAGDAGFAVGVGEVAVELGAGGHYLLVGGAEGVRWPRGGGGGDGEGMRVEATVVPHAAGRVLALWHRPVGRRRLRVVWALDVEEGGRVVVRRGEGEDVVFAGGGEGGGGAGGRAEGWIGAEVRLGVEAGGGRTVLYVDGEEVAAGPGGEVPGEPVAVMVGSHKEGGFSGLAVGLRMVRTVRAGDGEDGGDGGGGRDETTVGEWSFVARGDGGGGETDGNEDGGGSVVGGRGPSAPSVVVNTAGAEGPRPATGSADGRHRAAGDGEAASRVGGDAAGGPDRDEGGREAVPHGGGREGLTSREGEAAASGEAEERDRAAGAHPGGSRVAGERGDSAPLAEGVGSPSGEEVGRGWSGGVASAGDSADAGREERGGRIGRRVFEDRAELGAAAELRGGEGAARWLPVDLAVGAGRFYAGGMLVRLGEATTVRGQEDLPDARLPVPEGRGEEHHVVYLDVWERTVSPAEDAGLVEPALGGADTVTHGRLVAQVRSRRWQGGADMASVWEGWTPAVPPLAERGRMAARRRRPAAEELENVLYRVEVHHGGDTPSFKWSRHNASAVYPVAAVDDGGLVRMGPSARDLDGLEVGAVVEPVEHAVEVGARPGTLHRVVAVDTSRQRVTVQPPIRGGEQVWALRLWDQRHDLGAGGAVPVRIGEWQGLESGVEVRFDGSSPYRVGDYWWLPARTVSGDVDWSAAEDGTPRALPPVGVEHATTPLALLSYTGDGFRLADLRRTFHPHAVDAVRKAGDWMDGPLDLRSDLAVAGDAEVEGRLRADSLYGRVMSPGAVGPRQLAIGAVTVRSLAPDVGVVPDGASVLLPGRGSPPGFVATGWTVTAEREEPGWEDHAALPDPQPGPLVSVALGDRVHVLLESGEVWSYDPAEDSWRGGLGLPEPLHGFAACGHDGAIYVAGGVAPEGQPSERLLRYDPERAEWVELAPLPTPRSHLALVACGGRLHALGGWEPAFLGPRTSRRHEVYEPGIDTWTSTGRLRLPRGVASPAAVAVGDRIHLAGGEGRWLFGRWGSFLTDDHLVHREGSGTWSPLAPLPSPRRRPGLAGLHSHVAAVAGEGAQGWLDDADLYDPASDTWRPLPHLHRVVDAPGVTALAGTLYLTGAPAADGSGVLMESCPVLTRFHVHRRVAGEVIPPPARAVPPR